MAGIITTTTCRICLQELGQFVQSYLLNAEDDLMLQTKLLEFFPEIDLNITPNPLVCIECSTMIIKVHQFKQLCIQTESVLKNRRLKPPLIKEEKIKEEFVEVVIEVDESISYPTFYYCHNCNYATSEKDDLGRHAHTHRYECEKCSYVTPNSISLMAHQETHFDVGPFQCNICDLVCSNTHTFKMHVTTHTLDELSQFSNKVSDEKLFDCYFCDYSTNSNNTLEHHMMSHKISDRLQCNVCKFVTCSTSVFKSHLDTHKSVRVYNCVLCDFSTKIKNHLKVHSRFHEKVKPFACVLCRFCGVTHSDLKEHLEQHNVKVFNCSKCEYWSWIKFNVLKHTYQMHEDEKVKL